MYTEQGYLGYSVFSACRQQNRKGWLDMSRKRILGVIGLGHVGAHVAYSLAVQGIADELVLVDQNELKLKSEVQDLRDAAAYLPHRVTVRTGDFPIWANAT